MSNGGGTNHGHAKKMKPSDLNNPQQKPAMEQPQNETQREAAFATSKRSSEEKTTSK